jgi:Replication factor-A protein 1, N-terminal domain
MDTLTQGAVAKIAGMKNSEEDPSFQPIVQVINLRKVNASGSQDRYRVSLLLQCFYWDHHLFI